MQRAQKDVRAWLASDGYDIVQMQHRWVRQGPLFWTTTRSQIVYRVVVRDTSGGQRAGWARWGRRWLFEGDSMNLVWDE